MPKMYIKIQDKNTKKEYFMQWSTITDTPYSDVMDEKTFKKEFDLTEEEEINLDKTNCSNPFYTVAELVDCSNEFKNQKSLLQYCKNFKARYL